MALNLAKLAQKNKLHQYSGGTKLNGYEQLVFLGSFFFKVLPKYIEISNKRNIPNKIKKMMFSTRNP